MSKHSEQASRLWLLLVLFVTFGDSVGRTEVTFTLLLASECLPPYSNLAECQVFPTSHFSNPFSSLPFLLLTKKKNYCMWMSMTGEIVGTDATVCGGQRTTLWSWFTLSNFIWVLGVEVQSPDLWASSFTHRAISPVPSLSSKDECD